MGIISKGNASQEAPNRQSRDAEHRAAKLNLSHKDQALAATDDLFFKERGNARCSAETTHSSLESCASSNLKHDSLFIRVAESIAALREKRICRIALHVIGTGLRVGLAELSVRAIFWPPASADES